MSHGENPEGETIDVGPVEVGDKRPVAEPSPIRDNGPYAGPDQALKQYAAVTHGIPGTSDQMCAMIVREALLMTGVGVSNSFEIDYLDAFMERHADPIMAQIITGWIIRSYMLGKGIEIGQQGA